MELRELQHHIRRLAMLEETSSPIVSCYINLETNLVDVRHTVESQMRKISKGLPVNLQPEFDEVFENIEKYLNNQFPPATKGLAIFARGGAWPFWQALQFCVPLPNWLAIDTTPNIYHLVELKDTYHRYVVMILTEEKARIIEVNLGSVTEELWRERPELRQRVGREWSREHYQSHRRKRTDQFIKEQISVLERLMSAGGHSHLILAGNPRLLARVRRELPRPLTDKLIDTVVASGSDKISDVVAATLSCFIEQEELESQAMVERLQRNIHTGGLAVIGTKKTLKALKRGQVDMLLVAKNYTPSGGWKCLSCAEVRVCQPALNKCPDCNSNEVRSLDLREEIIRLAEQRGCHVEVVNQSEWLHRVGGVGALLRYFVPEQHYERQRSLIVRQNA